MTHDNRIETAALDWVIRQRDPAFADWEDFTDWLDADPAHAEAYHEAVALDADLAGLPKAPAEEPGYVGDNIVALPRHVNRRMWLTNWRRMVEAIADDRPADAETAMRDIVTNVGASDLQHFHSTAGASGAAGDD